MNLEFYVDENVLIPQPDTECLVEEVIKLILEKYSKDKQNSFKILDLCTGSGAIAISVYRYINDNSKNRKLNIDLDIYASDISSKALEIARKNAVNNNANIDFILSNMFSNIFDTDFDYILSNPPYIETENIQSLSIEVQSEPFIALDGGEDGLKFYKEISEKAFKYMNPNGKVLLEIGYNQKKDVIDLFSKSKMYTNISCIKDLSGNDRVIKMDVKNKQK